MLGNDAQATNLDSGEHAIAERGVSWLHPAWSLPSPAPTAAWLEMRLK